MGKESCTDDTRIWQHQCQLLDIVLDNTPEILRDLLVNNYMSWTDFEADVTKVSVSQLHRAKQRMVMDRKLWEDVDKLQTQTANGHKAMQPPSQPSQVPYITPPPYQYGYHYNSPMMSPLQNQTPAPSAPPMFQPQVPLLTPQVPQTPQAAHLFTPAAPVSHGNLFYGYEGTYRPQLVEEAHMQITCALLPNSLPSHITPTLKPANKHTPSSFKTGMHNMDQMPSPTHKGHIH
ncbi:hypothetical protein EDD22DRAFT_955808 [Suillus occidentalis]|nr:hypothetical protein EDD22DRAFT_955808 [Suillus occidentalis]